jgi:hypothetical protein
MSTPDLNHFGHSFRGIESGKRMDPRKPGGCQAFEPSGFTLGHRPSSVSSFLFLFTAPQIGSDRIGSDRIDRSLSSRKTGRSPHLTLLTIMDRDRAFQFVFFSPFLLLVPWSSSSSFCFYCAVGSIVNRRGGIGKPRSRSDRPHRIESQKRERIYY